MWTRLRYSITFFASIYTGKYRDWENEKLSTVEEDQVQDHVKNLKMNISMGPDEMHLQILREIDGTAKPLAIIFEKLRQSGEIPTDRKREMRALILKK